MTADLTGTHAELYDLLPHRHPILLVDRITGWEPDTWMETVKAVCGSEPCYAWPAGSTAPARYAYPAVLILESFVQSAAALWARSARAAGDGLRGTLVFGGASQVVFHRTVAPGDTLRHRVRLGNRIGSNAFFTGETTLDGTGDPVLTVGSIVLGTRAASILDRAEARR
jgi:3-hydroxyacyl-[acyl-carrier-protein] dehydratase